MEREWKRMKREIRMANQVPSNGVEADAFRAELQTEVRTVVAHCRAARKRKRESAPQIDTSDERLFEGARFTDHLPLANYENVLHLVPRLVNIVSLAEAVPVPGSGVKLPLDLHAIAARCSNAYYAPKRFAAVQLAFSNYRCRVLVFHTGRFVGTGCSGPMAARLAILKAARQLAVEAGVHVVLRKFAVINQVGAVSIDAKLDCDAFASTHSATSHYDRASFVGAPPAALPALPARSLHPSLRAGLAWRPGGEPICCEIYGTGRANLPGSTRQRDLLLAFSRMVSELLRHSSKPEVRELLKAHLQQCHRPRQVQRDDAPVQAASRSASRSVPHAREPAAPGPLHDLFGEEDGWLMPALSAVPLPGAAGGRRTPSADADDELLANAGYCLG